MKKTIVVVFFFFFCVSPFLISKVMAADMVVICSEFSTCSINGADPLFTTVVDGIWYPGRILTKTIKIKNESKQIREMALKGTGNTVNDTLKNVMNLNLTNSKGAKIWSGNLADFYNQVNISLGIFDPGTSLEYNMAISMNSSANDDYREKQSVFDLTLGFWGEPIPTIQGVQTGGEVAGAEAEAGQVNWRRLILPGFGLVIVFLFLTRLRIKLWRAKGGEK